MERIDLYQLHSPDDKVPFAESVGALKELQAAGKISLVGLCNVSRTLLNEARQIVDVVTVQNRYNLTDRGSEKVLDACTEASIGFIPWFPLATGNLARPDGAVATVAERLRCTPSQVALAWLLHRSPAMLPIPGTASVLHLEENVAAAGVELTDEDYASLERL
jgi:aryl-alcohol dehydrogenase-like predicted oxidoreductase